MTETSGLSALRDALLARERAPRDAPVRVHNKLMKSVQKQCDVLAETPIGRERLTAAAVDDPDLLLRLVAATTVQRWDRAAARAALEHLVLLSGGTVVRPMTMTAALAVRGEPGGSAALCLINLDRPRPVTRTPSPAVSQRPVSGALLDAAERVYNLAMNGGIDHAYELAGEQFLTAAEACDAIGATDEATVLRATLALVTGTRATRPERAAALESLSDEDGEALQALTLRFCVVDDFMECLEAAAEHE